MNAGDGGPTDLDQLAAVATVSITGLHGCSLAVGLPGRECCEGEGVSVRHDADLENSKMRSQMEIQELCVGCVPESVLVVVEAGCCS